MYCECPILSGEISGLTMRFATSNPSVAVPQVQPSRQPQVLSERSYWYDLTVARPQSRFVRAVPGSA